LDIVKCKDSNPNILQHTDGPPYVSYYSVAADSAATDHFFTIEAPICNRRETDAPIKIRAANGGILESTHVGEISLPQLPPQACHVHVVPGLASMSLLAMGPLCDAGCTIEFDATTVHVWLQEQLVLQGRRVPPGLWIFQLPTPAITSPQTNNEITPQVNSAIGAPKAAELVAYAHATLFSPALDTLEKALRRGYVRNFPGLTAKTLQRHPPHSVATAKGHLDQVRKNLRSTRMKPKDVPTPDLDDVFPAQESPTSTCYVTAITLPTAPTGKYYTDQTGRFPCTSSSGSNYVLVAYHYDSNAILVEPLQNRKSGSILAAHKRILDRLRRAGVQCSFVMLDNECSLALQQFFNDKSIQFQKTPAGMHRRNAAERAIRTFKNHFVAGLCTVNEAFPLYLWDKLLQQAELTLNLLRGSRMNPKLAAWEQLNGVFDYNATPLGPPGTRVLVHDKPQNRGTWAPHGQDAWYIGPALDHYRCYTVWMWDTRRERETDTLTWFPQQVTMPTPTAVDIIAAGIQDIAKALNEPKPNSPLNPLTNQQAEALRDLVTVFTGVLPDDDAVGTPSRLRVEPQKEKEPDIPTATEAQPTVPPAMIQSPPLPSVTYADVARRKPRRNTAPTQPPAPEPTSATPEPLQPAASTSSPTSDNPNLRRSRRRRKRKVLSSLSAERCDNLSASVPDTTPSPEPTDSVLPSDVVDDTMFWALHSTAINPDTQSVAEYDELSKCSDGELWIQANTEEFGRLAQGLGKDSDMPTGTDTIFFIHPSQMPNGRKATYLRIVCADRPEKTQTRRVRHTIGGDLIDYPGSTSTKTADLPTVKVLFNSVISTPDGRFMTVDLKDFFLGTPLKDRFEYLRIPAHVIPDTIMDLYDLQKLVVNGFVYAEVRRGMYGLPQAAIIANKQLQEKLAPHGYRPVPITPGLWKHDTRDIAFALVVDDFGIKYTKREDAEHLVNTLQHVGYKLSQEWDGNRYCGLTLKWDYDKRTCNVSMPGYVERALQRFQHPTPTRAEHSPYHWNKPKYGAKVQYADADDTTPVLDAPEKKRVQEIIGTFLFYARAVDITMLKALGTLSTQQSKPTEATMESIVKFLNYAATHPDAELQYIASDMILWIDSDASYLSEPNARSTCAGAFFLSDSPRDPSKPPQPQDPEPADNAPIHVLCSIMREIVSSAAEAELGGLFHNGKDGCPIRTCLEELGHPQPPTPLKTDNTTADGIANDTVKQKRSKAIDMRFYWIRDRVRQGQYHVYWRRSGVNRGDYYTKHHPTRHHQEMRPQLLHQANVAGHYSNYYEPLNNDDDDDDEGYYAFTITSMPSIGFSSTIQIQTFDPECTTLQTSPDSCEGVLIPDSRDSESPGSPNHESLGTQHIAVTISEDGKRHPCQS
jgi:hypothetical protein